MHDDILKKFAEANALAKNSGGYKGTRTNNQWAEIVTGANRVRLGGVFVISSQHFIEKLMQPQFMRTKQPGADNKGKFAKSMTCLCWNIDQEKAVDDVHKCCAVCDLRQAARLAERSLKEAEQTDEVKELVKQFQGISGSANPRMRYMWPAIMRDNPLVTIEEEGGKKTEVFGWKALALPMEANKGIESLIKQYPKILDPDEGVDIVINKTAGTRTTYTVQFALDGTSIAITPLTEEERATEIPEMRQFIYNHPSPRQVFVALNEVYQELITKYLNKGAEDYPEEAPIKRDRYGDRSKVEVRKESADISNDLASPKAPVAKTPAAAPAKTPPPVKSAPVTPKPPAPKPPAPAPVSAPKPPAPKPPAPKPPAAQPAQPVASDVPTPACFGTCDRADPQCSECVVINECEAKKNEQ